jgi:catechol 2,3-dioxygenase-like lactoylglutathione lyase family enzyme
LPGFHHLHLNSTNPDAAIAFYVKEFPSTSKTTWGGQPALKSPNNVLVLFDRVDTPPATQPQTAVWHFGWHVTNERQAMDRIRRDGVTLLPLYTTEEGGTVTINSDTWPGSGGVLGLTKAGIAEAKAKGVKPAGGAGFAYIRGPANLDAWVAKLRSEGVTFLMQPYTIGDSRAVMIEGPGREALELVEVK